MVTSLFGQIEPRFGGYFCSYLGFLLTFLSDLSAYPYLFSHSYMTISILRSNFGPKYHYLWKLKTDKQKNLTRFGFHLITVSIVNIITKSRGVSKSTYSQLSGDVQHDHICIDYHATKFTVEASVESFGTVLILRL